MARKRMGRPTKAVAVRRDYPVLRVRIEPDLKALIDALREERGLSLRELLHELTGSYLDGLSDREKRRLLRKARARLRPKP